MQTFLPLSDFKSSAECLDYKRLGKQRVEAKQILNALTSTATRKSGWHNHPAVKMWRGYEDALAEYHDACIAEWVRRGYNNNMAFIGCVDAKKPSWFGLERFHASHRSNLLRKDAAYYGRYGWAEPNDLPYQWPV